MHVQKLPTMTSLQFPMNEAQTVAVSEFSSKIFVFTADGRLCTFHRKIVDVPGRSPKIFIQRMSPDKQLPMTQPAWISFIDCSPVAPKAYMNVTNQICVLNTDTSEVTKNIPYPINHVVGNPKISPDGRNVYFSDFGHLVVLSTATDEEVNRIETEFLKFIVFSPDSKRLYGFGDDAAVSIDTATGKVILKKSHNYSDIPQICISNDGKNIYVPQFSSSGYISVVDPNTMKETDQIPDGSLPGGIASSPNHPYVAACNDSSLEIIDSRTNKIVDSITLFGRNLLDVAIDKHQISYIVDYDKFVVARYY